LVIFLLIMESLVGCSASRTARAEDPVGPLTWSPPAGWQRYHERVIPPWGGTIELDPDRDYRISAPETITGAVHVRGGRNVVWIGGHIRIDDKASRASAISRRALAVSDAKTGSSPGRIVHLEGLLLDGNDLSEGIDTNCPTAVVQLEYVHIGVVRLRGADDRDGTAGYPAGSHPDIVQTWGSQRELRIDGLTGSSNYQGLMFKEDTPGRVRGPVRLRNVNVRMVELKGEDGIAYAGHRGYYLFPDSAGQQFIDNGTVWVSHHPNSGWVGDRHHKSAYRDTTGNLVPDPPPGTSTFQDNVYPRPNIGRDATGTYAFWDESINTAGGRLMVHDWGGAAGRIYSGVPANGDFVPASEVGTEYVPRGYRRLG
jgi:hypothetical protein